MTVQDREMSESRFDTLAASYGADLQRWPLVERAAADRLAFTSERARAVLAKQRRLDDQLASYVIAPPTTDFIGRILASAPTSRSHARHRRLWWSVGLLGAALAGSASGAAAVTLLLSLSVKELDAQTIFGDITVTEFIYE